MQSIHEVPHKHFRGLMVCAVRYALPRHTYVTSEARDWIEALAHELGDADLECMQRDIEQALREHESGYYKLHDCDLEEWNKSLSHIKKLQQERLATPHHNAA